MGLCKQCMRVHRTRTSFFYVYNMLYVYVYTYNGWQSNGCQRHIR